MSGNVYQFQTTAVSEDGHQDLDEPVDGAGGDRGGAAQPRVVLGQHALAPLPRGPLLGRRSRLRRRTRHAAPDHYGVSLNKGVCQRRGMLESGWRGASTMMTIRQ